MPNEPVLDRNAELDGKLFRISVENRQASGIRYRMMADADVFVRGRNPKPTATLLLLVELDDGVVFYDERQAYVVAEALGAEDHAIGVGDVVLDVVNGIGDVRLL